LATDGNIIETNINIVDLITVNNIISGYAIPKLQSPVGGKIIISTSDGGII